MYVQASRPLLQALHTLAVCCAAGLAPGSQDGLRLLQQQLAQESLDGETLPAEGEQCIQMKIYCYSQHCTG